MNEAFLIGNGQMQRIIGQRGETPPCEAAKFKRGDVVKVRNRRALEHFPREAVVAVAIPPGFSPDFALADLVGEPRPLMAQVGARGITYQAVVSFKFPGMKIAPATCRMERGHNHDRFIGPIRPEFSCCYGDKEAFEAWVASPESRVKPLAEKIREVE